MNDADDEFRAVSRDQSCGNLRLAPAFFQELLDLPEDAEPIPAQATVILLPPAGHSNSALYQANMRMARTLAAEGENVVLWTVGSGKATKLQEFDSALATDSPVR